MHSRLINFKKSIFPKREPVFAAAPTQNIRRGYLSAADEKSIPIGDKKGLEFDEISIVEVSSREDVTSIPKITALDKITKLAGSSSVFFVMMFMVGVWFVLGLIYGMTDTWQIIFQNTSSIQVYVTDILLIRQQHNASRALLTTVAELRSRNQTCERLLKKIPGCTYLETHHEPPKPLLINGKPLEEVLEKRLSIFTGEPSRLGSIWIKTCHVVSSSLGSIYAFVIYWLGIIAWIAIGPVESFSNRWQLDVNTGTAICLTFTSVFLQNIQQRQEDHLSACLSYALKIDEEIEYCLREITHDTAPNPIFEIPAATRSWKERQIDVFADIMGSGLGVAISFLFTIGWIAVGPLLEFNDNWWLIIGTFTGLVGFIDGFVLRSIYLRSERYMSTHFSTLAYTDSLLLERLNISLPTPSKQQHNLAKRISIWTGERCGSSWAPVGATVIVIALLVIATAMKWSETAQLLCNTPTMIVEGFLLLVLIQSHEFSNEERGGDFRGLLGRRLRLAGFARELEE